MNERPLKILKASAGSGKTYQLVLEFLKLTLLKEDPSRFTQINAMTFTNKASLEMKERILEALEKLSAEKNSTHYDEKFLNDKVGELGIPAALIQERAKVVLNKILHHYSDFHIQTLDSFTGKIVRTFANDIAITNDFEIELDTDQIVSLVMERLMSNIGQDKDLTELFRHYTEFRNEQEKYWDVSTTVKDFYKTIQKENIQRELAKFDTLNLKELQDFAKEKREYVNSIDKKVKEIIQPALDAFYQSGIDRNVLAGGRGTIIGSLEKALADITKYELNKTCRKAVEEDKWLSGKHKDTDISSFKEAIRSAYIGLNEIINNELSNYKLHKIVLDNIYNIGILGKVNEAYKQIKDELNILPISDFNMLIQNFIENEPSPYIFERLGTRFKHFLLDEFQDTSVLQWKNLIPLVENSLGEGEFNLIVGDAKQAIYRWRNGEVDQFISLPKLYNPENNEFTAHRSEFFEEMGKNESLKQNFRSKQEVVQFNNDFFQELTKQISEKYQSVYEKDSATQDAVKSEGGYIQAQEVSSKEESVEYARKQLQEAIDDGYELRDVAILSRTKVLLKQIAKEFTKEGIPVSSFESLAISSDQHVQLLSAIVEHYLFPADQAIKKLIADKAYGILESAPTPSKAVEQFVKTVDDKRFFDFEGYLNALNLSNEVFYPDYGTLYELGEKLIANFKFDLENNAYLQLYLDLLYQFDQKPNATLYQFNEWYQLKGKEKSIQVSESENAVKLLTIHKSKGLQYPVVICPSMGDSLSLRDEVALIPMKEFQPELPAVLTPLKSSLTEGTEYEHYRNEEQEKIGLDFINLTYVAFTRAVDRLYIGINTNRNTGGGQILKAVREVLEEKGEGNFSMGTRVRNEASNADTQQNDPIPTIKEKLWFPDISFESDDHLDKEPLEKVEFGKQMHEFLSHLQDENNPEQAFNYLLQKGRISIGNKEDVLKQYDLLVQDIEIKNLLETKGLIEQEILLPDGNSIRPDKLIFSDKDATIIDFKTGAPTKKDIAQVESYKRALGEMQYQPKAYLIYTELGKLVGV